MTLRLAKSLDTKPKCLFSTNGFLTNFSQLLEDTGPRAELNEVKSASADQGARPAQNMAKGGADESEEVPLDQGAKEAVHSKNCQTVNTIFFEHFLFT